MSWPSYDAGDSSAFVMLAAQQKAPMNMANSKRSYSIKLSKPLYGLKRSRRMLYNHISEYLLKEGSLSLYQYENIRKQICHNWLLKDDKHLNQEVPYLSVIGVLMYLANYTQPNITFVVNWLSKI